MSDGQGRPSSSFTGDVDVNALAETLSEVARSLQDAHTLQDTLGGVVRAAAHTVPGARHAGITAVRPRGALTTVAATDDLVRGVDKAQYETGQGPCVDAAHDHHTLRLSDMAQERRWPDFRRRVADMGVGSMLSFQLYVLEDNLGALNLYSPERDAFTDESEYVGLLFASHAAIAMVGAQRRLDMDHAVGMRDMIGQAKGILMERHRLSADQAFGVLIHASQRTNTKLSEIARRLTETGEIPKSAADRR